MKRCTNCKIEKDFSEFYCSKGNKDGLKSKCRKCSKEYRAKYVSDNPGKIRDGRKRDKEKLKIWHANYYRSKEGEEKLRNGRLKRLYGVDYNTYTNLVEIQNNLCAICNNPEKRATSATKYKKEVNRLSIDHCHETGKVRGLLCSNCNTVLGLIKEDPKILNNMKEYLEKYK